MKHAMRMLAITVSIGIIFFTSPFFVLGQTIPDFPMAFWGNVSINGVSAPVGTILKAYYGSQLAGQVTIQSSGVYGYDNPTQQRLVVGQGSGPIVFGIQSSGVNEGQEVLLSPSPAIYFSSGKELQENLAFVYTTQSGGGGSSGNVVSGGGGGGGGVLGTVSQSMVASATTSSSTTSGSIEGNINTFNLLMIYWGKDSPVADLNKDGIVNILDFNMLMINWSS